MTIKELKDMSEKELDILYLVYEDLISQMVDIRNIIHDERLKRFNLSDLEKLQHIRINNK